MKVNDKRGNPIEIGAVVVRHSGSDTLDSPARFRRLGMHYNRLPAFYLYHVGMRLVHLGCPATIVGDTTTPAIRADDLLVVCSRTGQSPILRHAVSLAHNEGARAVAVVGLEHTPLEAECECVVRIPMEAATAESHQPLGSLFEQALLLYLDRIVLGLMAELRTTVEDMARIHSNLP